MGVDGGASGAIAGAGALPAFLADFEAIVVAALAPDGSVRQANRGFWRLLGERGEALAVPGAPWCVEPGFQSLTGRERGEGRGESERREGDGADATDAIYRGRITLGDPAGAGHTVRGSFGRFGDGWLLVAEVDVAGSERLAERVLELNRDLSARQRELARANRLLRQREDELVRLSNTDALTGLPNRRHVLERLVQEVARSDRSGEPLSVAMVDLDDFKGINDVHGHAAGDRVLVGVAAALRSGLRSYDVAGRLGGDEFAVLLPGADEGAARDACERLLAGLGTVARAPDEAAPPVGASIGVATFSGGARRGEGEDAGSDAASHAGSHAGSHADALLARADRALYRAKRAGGNRVTSAAD